MIPYCLSTDNGATTDQLGERKAQSGTGCSPSLKHAQQHTQPSSQPNISGAIQSLHCWFWPFHCTHPATNHARQAPGAVSCVPQGLAAPLPPPPMHICQGQFHWHNAHFPKPAKTSSGVLQRNFHFSGNVRGFGEIQAKLVHVFRKLFLKLEAAHFSAGDVLTPLTSDTAQPSPSWWSQSRWSWL